MKKLISMLLTVAVIFAMCVPMAAFATQAKDTGSITVPSETGHTYDIYQILTGDVAEDEKTLSNVAAGQNYKGTNTEAGIEAAVNAINAVLDKTNREKLDVIEDYVDLTSTAFKSGVAAGAKVENLATGYYLVKDASATTGNDTDTTYLVAVVGAVTLNAKTGVPTVEKKVKDVNDSTGATATTDWQDTADYDINDEIEFQITGTLPSNYADYKEYFYQFYDTMTNMTYKEGTVKVTLVKTVEDGDTTKEVESDVTSKFYTNWDAETKTLRVQNVNLKNVKNGIDVEYGDKFIVTYKATLDEDAVIGGTGNPNTVKVNYSNNPNFEKSGTTTPKYEDEDNPNSEYDDGDTPGTPPGDTPTGDTPVDTNVIFTLSLTADKVKEDGTTALEGAGFTLYKKINNAWEIVGEEITGKTTFEWKGIDDGEYKIVESTTPDGYSTAKDVEFTVTAEHSINADGVASITSLTTTNEKVTATTASTGALATTIVNTPGKALPTTGGIGTTLFYVFGAILVLGAAVLLIARRRADAR